MEFPKRHLVFQLGSTNRKPWDLKVAYTTQSHFIAAISTPLLFFDKNYNIRPGIFKDWNWQDKSTSYIFQIDQNYKYENFRGVEAEDIEFAILKNFISSNENTDKRMFSDIKGAEKLKPGMRFKTGMCEGVKILAKDKIQIFLKQRNPTFLYVLGDLTTYIAPEEDFQSDLFSFKGIPRGPGAYRVEWSDPGSSLVRLKRKIIDKEVLEKTNYPLTIDFFDHGNAFENNADLAAGAGTNGLKGKVDYKYVGNSVPTIVQVIDFNYGNSYGKNLEFRKAVSLALSRQKIFETYSDIHECHELVPEGYYGRTNLKFRYDPALAKEIVSKEFPELLKGKHIKATFHGGPNQNSLPRFVQSIQQQLKEVGIAIDFESSAYVSFNNSSKEIAFGTYGSVTSFVDPLAPFVIYATENSGFENHTDLKDEKAKKLYKSAAEAIDRETRANKVRELSAHFYQNVRVLPLEQRGASFSYWTKTLQKPNLEDSFYTINYNGLVLIK